MADSSDNLQAFINKMLQLQNENRDKPLSDEELKEIAFDIGITEEDWLLSQKAFQDYLKSGKSHLNLRNWNDAIYSFNQALILRPNHVEVLFHLALTHKEMWAFEADEDHKDKAVDFARRALKIKPAYPPAMNLLGEIKRLDRQKTQNKSQLKVMIFSGLAVFLVVVSLYFYTVYNGIIAQQETVNQKWAQVENVYQRRADLIPQLVSTLKAQSKGNQNKLDKLLFLHQESAKQSDQSPEAFQKSQNEISKALKDLRNQLAGDTELSNAQAYHDLKVNIEGSENRIAVERKRYNEAVGTYNRYIKRFPRRLLGFEEKPYFEIDKTALEKPSIDL